MLSLLLGAAFEIPIIAYFLSKLGLITAPMLKQYRKYDLVGILVIAAIITPTSDVFTLLLVSIPLYFLYELSIQVAVSYTHLHHIRYGIIEFIRSFTSLEIDIGILSCSPGNRIFRIQCTIAESL